MSKARGMELYSLNIPLDLAAKMREASKAQEMTTSNLIRDAIRNHIAHLEEDSDLLAIESTYLKMNEHGKEWLALAAEMAASRRDFKA